MANPLVAVHKRMIHDQRKAQRGRLGLEGRIEFVATKRHPWLHNRGFDATHFAHAVRTARLVNDAAMKLDNFGQPKVTRFKLQSQRQRSCRECYYCSFDDR